MYLINLSLDCEMVPGLALPCCAGMKIIQKLSEFLRSLILKVLFRSRPKFSQIITCITLITQALPNFGLYQIS
jgi:hypothetical protein